MEDNWVVAEGFSRAAAGKFFGSLLRGEAVLEKLALEIGWFPLAWGAGASRTVGNRRIFLQSLEIQVLWSHYFDIGFGKKQSAEHVSKSR